MFTEPLLLLSQIELHPMLTQDEIVKYCAEKGIAVTAYSPLIRANQFDHKTLKAVTAHYPSKTAAQVLIRWSVQKGYICIPKSVNKARIVQNADVFDFSLTDEDMTALDGMNADHHEAWDPTVWDA